MGITTDRPSDVVGDQIIIEGGTDGTQIGNVGDRLKVDSVGTTLPSPGDKVAYTTVNALNAGSADMTVDGSTTPVEFTVGPPAGEDWYLFEYGLIIEDSGNNTISNFGAINGGLTTGLLIEQHIGASTVEFVNLKTNLDLVESFSDSGFRGTANAFLNATNFYAGKVELRQPIILSGDDGDEIHVHVRDDLTGLNQLSFNIEYYKAV